MTLKLDSLTQVATTEEAGVWVDILHPAGFPLCLGGQAKPFRIRMAGSYSHTYRQHVKRQREELIKNRGARTTEDTSNAALATLVACTLEWEGAFDDDGQPIPFTPANVRTVYEAAEFIHDQADVAVFNHASFFKPPSSTP